MRARQVDSAVRYSVRNAVGREVGRLTIRINGLRTGPLEALPGGSVGGSSKARSLSRAVSPFSVPAISARYTERGSRFFARAWASATVSNQSLVLAMGEP